MAFGVGPYLTDAQHVSVEFVHPVIVGKRALPALDLSAAPERMAATCCAARRHRDGLRSARRAMRELTNRLADQAARGALVCQWPGRLGEHPLPAASHDPFIHQELTELMYHTLWETVHVFFEQQTIGHDVGRSAFLVSVSGQEGRNRRATRWPTWPLRSAQKAAEDERLREQVAAEQAERVGRQRRRDRASGSRAGGTLFAFGNGGSATDANDLVLDCVDPPTACRRFRPFRCRWSRPTSAPSATTSASSWCSCGS